LSRAHLVLGATISVVALALLVRTLQYLANSSFSLDEAQLALNIMHRPYGDLLHELDFNQGAPPAFLFLEKTIVDVFGTSEYAFRALPFVASLLSVALVIPFVRGWGLGTAAALLAATFFGFASGLIWHASVAKPYAVDVLVTLVLCILAAGVIHEGRVRSVWAWTLVGAIALWFSFPAVFILAGTGTALVLAAVAARRWNQAALYITACTVWLVSFGLLYLVSIRDLRHLQRSIQGSSALGSQTGPGDLQTFAGALRSDLGIPHIALGGTDVGRILFVVAILFATGGFVGLARRRPMSAGALVLPFVFTLAATRFGEYPLFARTILFLVPLFAALVGYGAVFVAQRAGRPAQIVAVTSIAVVALSVAALSTRAPVPRDPRARGRLALGARGNAIWPSVLPRVQVFRAGPSRTSSGWLVAAATRGRGSGSVRAGDEVDPADLARQQGDQLFQAVSERAPFARGPTPRLDPDLGG
jgi:hypothetical protein